MLKALWGCCTDGSEGADGRHSQSPLFSLETGLSALIRSGNSAAGIYSPEVTKGAYADLLCLSNDATDLSFLSHN